MAQLLIIMSRNRAVLNRVKVTAETSTGLTGKQGSWLFTPKCLGDNGLYSRLNPCPKEAVLFRDLISAEFSIGLAGKQGL